MNTKLTTFHHSSELNPKAFKAEAIVRTSGGREIQIISQSDKDMIATALVQLVARHVPAATSVVAGCPPGKTKASPVAHQASESRG